MPPGGRGVIPAEKGGIMTRRLLIGAILSAATMLATPAALADPPGHGLFAGQHLSLAPAHRFPVGSPRRIRDAAAERRCDVLGGWRAPGHPVLRLHTRRWRETETYTVGQGNRTGLATRPKVVCQGHFDGSTDPQHERRRPVGDKGTRVSDTGGVRHPAPPLEPVAPPRAELAVGASRAVERERRLLVQLGIVDAVGPPANPERTARDPALAALDDVECALPLTTVDPHPAPHLLHRAGRRPMRSADLVHPSVVPRSRDASLPWAAVPYYICPRCKERSVDIDAREGFSKDAPACRHCGFGFLFELLDDYYPAPDTGFVVTDQERRVLAIGRGVFELTGFGEPDLIGRDVVDALQLSDDEAGRARARMGRPPARRAALDQDARGHREARRRRRLPRLRRRRRPARRAALLDAARRAQRLGERALLAPRLAGVADPPAVPDQEVREARPVGARDEPHEVALDLHRVLLPRERETLREPPHVRVDDDPLRVAALGRDDVRRLARDAREASADRRTPSGTSPSCTSMIRCIVPRSDFAFCR